MSEEELEQVRQSITQKQKKGFGLRAVQERIELYYGEGYGITMESEKGKGTTVFIRLPEKIKLIS